MSGQQLLAQEKERDRVLALKAEDERTDESRN
jgi:hypothetical protein